MKKIKVININYVVIIVATANIADYPINFKLCKRIYQNNLVDVHHSG